MLELVKLNKIFLLGLLNQDNQAAANYVGHTIFLTPSARDPLGATSLVFHSTDSKEDTFLCQQGQCHHASYAVWPGLAHAVALYPHK